MEYFLNSEGNVIVHNMIKTIQKNKDYLSEVDGAIGDGDHGINMSKGFTICEQKLKNSNPDLTTALNVLGKVLMMEIGGSMGPLYGTFFMSMSRVSKGKDKIDKYVFEEMIEEALKGIQDCGNAKVGDKTLIDTLDPAVKAYKSAVSQNKNFREALEAMKEAAEKGKESTRDMVAKVGRASRLGERSKGVLDAGATSCNLLIQSMADTIIDLVS